MYSKAKKMMDLCISASSNPAAELTSSRRQVVNSIHKLASVQQASHDPAGHLCTRKRKFSICLMSLRCSYVSLDIRQQFDFIIDMQ